MFKQRLLTAIVLIPIVILLILYANVWLLGGILVLICAVATKESWHLIPIQSGFMQAAFLVLILLGVWACFYLFPYWLSLGLWLWLFICIAIIHFPNSQVYWGYPVVVGLCFFLLLPLFVQSFIHIYLLNEGKGLILYLLFLVWAADSGAYIAGKRWGKTKLIPKVSPGKSWEGIAGGFICSLVVAVLGFIYFSPFSYFRWFFWSALTVIMSIFGDLFISILKRRCHLKDTGTLIHGHGGVLDRLDSLIAASPVFYLGLIYVPIGI